LEESSRGLILVLSRHFAGGTQKKTIRFSMYREFSFTRNSAAERADGVSYPLYRAQSPVYPGL
jgi:hypothetical protein